MLHARIASDTAANRLLAMRARWEARACLADIRAQIDSLILVSILLLGGIGNPWGLIVATIIVVVVPEKLQTIQEYRFLLYAALVVVVLLFRPQGLLPRPVRRYFPGPAR